MFLICVQTDEPELLCPTRSTLSVNSLNALLIRLKNDMPMQLLALFCAGVRASSGAGGGQVESRLRAAAGHRRREHHLGRGAGDGPVGAEPVRGCWRARRSTG